MKFDVLAKADCDVYTIQDFAECVKVGGFIPDDGVGFFGTETHYSYSGNVWTATKLEENATHVHWFNK